MAGFNAMIHMRHYMYAPAQCAVCLGFHKHFEENTTATAKMKAQKITSSKKRANKKFDRDTNKRTRQKKTTMTEEGNQDPTSASDPLSSSDLLAKP